MAVLLHHPRPCVSPPAGGTSSATARPPRCCQDGSKETRAMKKARSDGARPLPVQELRWHCDPATLGFETTEAVRPLDGVVGQERGVDHSDEDVVIRGGDAKGELSM